MAVSKLLGHWSIATTQIYLNHLQTAELRNTVPLLPVTEDQAITPAEGATLANAHSAAEDS